MVAHGIRGRIVTISSIAGHVGRLSASAYCASKAGVEMFTKVLAMELAEPRINEVAQAVLYLCSPAAYITGAVVPVDGGMDTGWTHMPYSLPQRYSRSPDRLVSATRMQRRRVIGGGDG